MIRLFLRDRGQPFINLRPAEADVVLAVERIGVRSSPVTSGTADFLVIGFD